MWRMLACFWLGNNREAGKLISGEVGFEGIISHLFSYYEQLETTKLVQFGLGKAKQKGCHKMAMVKSEASLGQ